MISSRKQRIETSQQEPSQTQQVFKAFLGHIWLVLVIAVITTILILIIEHAEISGIGSRFASSFIYAILIGFPAAILLNWIGFRYADRFPRFISLIYAGVLMTIATCGSLSGALVLRYAGIIPADFYWREVRGSLPICLAITLVVGLSVMSFETMRHRLQNATLELRTHQMQRERANKLLAEARLSSLESRIHPHFLFNTLNSISSLIPTDPKRAEETVGKLASLLRFSISANHNSLVPLAQELKIVRDYLEIETTRFGQRLRFDVSVPESLGDLKVPPLALQTLVENSIKHVVGQRSRPSSICVGGARRDGWCELTVSDDGPGFSLADISPDHGLGNLVGRLELLYGDAAQLNVSRTADKTVVTIRIPWGDAQ